MAEQERDERRRTMAVMPEPLDIAALREAAERATPGPWMQGMAGDKLLPEVDNRFHFGMVVLTEAGTDDGDGGLSTAAYIAATSPDVVLALLSEVEAERERGRALRAAVEAALAIRRGHQDSLPPGFEDRCECIACDMARALLAAHVPSPLPDGGAAGAGEVS